MEENLSCSLLRENIMIHSYLAVYNDIVNPRRTDLRSNISGKILNFVSIKYSDICRIALFYKAAVPETKEFCRKSCCPMDGLSMLISSFSRIVWKN